MNLPLLDVNGWTLLLHFASLSLLSVGGAISTVPEMHRTLVLQQEWLHEAQFNASIALAQAAPGPNILFVALLGWNVGLNLSANTTGMWTPWLSAMLGLALAMTGILLPSTCLTLAASRWAHRNRERRAVRAFKQGMAPIVIGLLVATGWILSANQTPSTASAWPMWLLTLFSTILVWRTRVHLLWLLGCGALLGGLGLI